MKGLSWYGLALALVSAALVASVRADDKKDDKDKADKVAAEDKKFEGTWVVTKMMVGGREGEQDLSSMTFTFKGKKYEQKNGDNLMEAGTQDLDPTKNPKHMDVNVTEGETSGQKQLAIYEIDGDTVKACFAQHGDKERPTKLKSEEGSNHIYIEMKRKKKD